MSQAYDFDATQYAPRQSLAAHPAGKFPASITALEAKPTKDGGGGYFAVTFSTQAGTIIKRYNIWSLSQQAVDIAHGELSALSYATGVMRWTMRDNGAALMRAQCVIEVGPQIDRTTGQPNGYNEVKKVFDRNGNDPSAPLTQQQPAQGFQPFPAQQQADYARQAQAGQQAQQPFPVDTGPMPGQPALGPGWAPGPDWTPNQAQPATQAPNGQPWAGPLTQAAPQPAPASQQQPQQSWQPQQQATPQGAPSWAKR